MFLVINNFNGNAPIILQQNYLKYYIFTIYQGISQLYHIFDNNLNINMLKNKLFIFRPICLIKFQCIEICHFFEVFPSGINIGI